MFDYFDDFMIMKMMEEDLDRVQTEEQQEGELLD